MAKKNIKTKDPDIKRIELIDEIIDLIKRGDIPEAKKCFRKLLTSIKLLKHADWSEEYIEKIEEFGELFKEGIY